jgi:molecular chaperone DnaK (HSP70)
MEVFLGIDLGTTTTLLGRALEEDGRLTVRPIKLRQKNRQGEMVEMSYLPSVAYYPATGEPLVGLEAQVRGPEEDASRYVRAVKRQMGRRMLLPVVEKEPYQVSAEYLAYALREGRRTFPRADTVFTVTVPASFTTNQRADTLRALRRACEQVGLPYPEDEGEVFISEPVAAVLAFLNQQIGLVKDVRKLDLSGKSRLIVYDIGGGTLDLTSVFVEPHREGVRVHNLADLRVSVEIIGYYNPFGGEDFDLALAQVLYRDLMETYDELHQVELDAAQRLGVRLQLMNVAKDTKEKLSKDIGEASDLAFLSDEPEDASRPVNEQIRIQGETYLLSSEITVSKYRETVRELLDGQSRKSLITPLKDLLKKIRMVPDDFHGMLVVGGAAKLPLVTEVLKDFWGNDRVWVYEPPDHAVVSGAAIYSLLRRRYPEFSLVEPAADTYYVRLKNRFDPILPAAEKEGKVKEYEIPVDSDKIILQIFAGEAQEPGKPPETVYPTLIHQGGTTIDLKKVYKKGTPVWVQMRYVGDQDDQDHSKIPWVYVWVETQDGEPYLSVRYSQLVEEAAHG